MTTEETGVAVAIAVAEVATVAAVATLAVA